MINSDKAEFAKIVLGFAELKGKQLSRPAVDLYWGAMQAWSIDDFKRAAEHLLRTCEFMPTPKDFEDLRKAGRPTSGEAFAMAVQHCASSAYRDGPHPDPIVHMCVRAIGGYLTIAMADQEKLQFLEKRFAEHFEHLQDAEDTRDAVPQITRPNRPQISGPRSFQDLLVAATEHEFTESP